MIDACLAMTEVVHVTNAETTTLSTCREWGWQTFLYLYFCHENTKTNYIMYMRNVQSYPSLMNAVFWHLISLSNSCSYFLKWTYWIVFHNFSRTWSNMLPLTIPNALVKCRTIFALRNILNSQITAVLVTCANNLQFTAEGLCCNTRNLFKIWQGKALLLSKQE